MTKGLKTVLIVLLSAVMVAGFAVFAGASSLRAGHANDQVTAFESAVALLEKDSYTEDLFAEPGYATKVKDAQDKYVTGASEATMNIYNSVMAVFEEPLDLEYYVTSTLFYRLNGMNGQSIRYSQNAELVGYEAIYAKYTDGSHSAVAAYLATVEGLTANLTSARTAMDTIKANIDTAVTAIDAIQYYSSNAMGTYVDGAIIVLDSQTSIGRKFDTANYIGIPDDSQGAYKALYDIYGTDFTALTDEHSTVSNYDKYVAAVNDLDAQYAKAAAVIGIISEMSKLITADVCWTVKDEVEAARAAYDALKTNNAATDGASGDFNDLQTLVTNYTTLTETEDRIGQIETAIANTVTAINAIGTVEYTDASLALIEAAETAFAELDKDIRDNDTAEGQQTFIVSNYTTLTAARAEYDALQAEVDAVIASIDGLKAYETEGNLYAAFIATEALYKALDANQKAKVDGTVNTYTPSGFTGDVSDYNKLYQYYQARANAILAEATPVIRAISALGNVVITQAYKAQLDDVRNLYDALSEQAKAVVHNYSELVAKEEQFQAAMASADAWVDQVEAIETPVTVVNKDKVETA